MRTGNQPRLRLVELLARYYIPKMGWPARGCPKLGTQTDQTLKAELTEINAQIDLYSSQ